METGLADFQSFFNEKVRARGLTLKKLAEVSGIPLRHLEHLSEGYYEKLPGAPYLQGYLRALGRVLDFDAEPWQMYFRELDLVKTSGASDRLPGNRFAFRGFPKYSLFALIGVLILIYFGLRFSQIFGKPVLSVEFPPSDQTRVEQQVISVRGKVENTDQLSVNAEPVLFGADGVWVKEISLQPGLNSIEVTARKFLGRETQVNREVIYELPSPPEEAEPVN
jgi:hypothetical protein